MSNNKGLALSSFQADVIANKPAEYPGEYNFALFYGTDDGTLWLAPRPAATFGVYASPVWSQIAVGSSAGLVPLSVENPAGANGASWSVAKHTLVLKGLPTAATGLTTGMVYSNAGVLTVV